MALRFELNGRPVSLELDPAMPLLWALRDALGLTGTKYGCGIGACGACTVHLDDEAARACTLPLAAVVGRRVTTIEGLPDTHPVLRAWNAARVAQCGYCQPGFVMAAVAVSRRQGRVALDDLSNLCRCGSHDAMRAALAMLPDGPP